MTYWKNKITEYTNCLLKSVLAGICIGIGALAFLSIDNKIIGSLFFSIGLFMILNFDLNLFTGKVCYVVENKSYLEVAVTLLGNFIGTALLASASRLTTLQGLAERSQIICQAKLDSNILNLFILSILCNVLIYLAVYGYKNFKTDISKHLALLFGVSVFIICGFEHSIADMFYFMFSNIYSWKAVLTVLVVISGNIVGGVCSRFCLGLKEIK